MSEFWLLVAYCGVLILVSLAGGLVPLLGHTYLQVYLSFGAGAMLGAALLHMLPESLELLGDGRLALELVLLGFLALFFTERFFTSHHHEHDPPAAGARLSWPAVVVGLSIHTLADGVALASAVAAGAGYWLGFGVFLAVALHKPADSLTIVAVMLQGGARKPWAHVVNLLFALIIPLGAALFFLARAAAEQSAHGSVTGWALAISVGVFLCVALTDLLPELHFHEHDRGKLSAALLLGVAIMYGAGLIGSHDHGHAHEHAVPHQHNQEPEHDHDHGHE